MFFECSLEKLKKWMRHAVTSSNMQGLPGGFAVSRNEFARRVTYVATMFVVDEGRMKST